MPASAPELQTAPASDWSALLDRLEERLRRIEAAATARPGVTVPDPGPEPGPTDVPTAPPSEAEQLRLLALVAGHEQLATRLSGRRRQLQQAEHYRLGAA
jgi:hypothetical protein